MLELTLFTVTDTAGCAVPNTRSLELIQLEPLRSVRVLCPVTTCGAGKSEIYNFWWLISVTLVVDWLFLSRNFGLVWGPTKAFCHSVNVHGVVVLFAGGVDTSTLHVITELF